MRAGPGTVGVIALALAVGAAVADAQSITRPLPAKGEATVASTSLAPPAGQLPGALMTTSSMTSIGLEQFEFEAYQAVDEDEEEEEGGFWPSFSGLPGSSSSHRGAALPAARGGMGSSSFSTFPGRQLLRRVMRTGIARIPDATRARLELLAAERQSRFLTAIGADQAESESVGSVGETGSIAVVNEARGTGNRRIAEPSTYETKVPSLLGINVPGRTESAARFDYAVTDLAKIGDVASAPLPSLARAQVSAAAVLVTPEPASLALIGTGVAALGFIARRRRML
jgi:hypothetical protein